MKIYKDKPELFQHIEEALKSSKQEIAVDHELTYKQLIPRLHAQPGSVNWKGAIKIRVSFSRLLVYLCLGQHQQKYGTGQPPNGWLAQYPWIDFKGPGTCSTKVCTDLIISILQALGIDPY